MGTQMTPEEKAVQERIKRIADRQLALGKRVIKLQDTLNALVVEGAERWVKNPEQLDPALIGWANGPLKNVVSGWARDLIDLSQDNAEYFSTVATGLTAKEYDNIAAETRGLVLDRFGIKPNGKLTGKGFFDTVLNDKSLLRSVKEQAWKAKASGVGVDQFKKDIKTLVNGAPGSKGLVERHFDTFAYDTYQTADAATQEHFAQKLGLPAALYLGGEITGTRPFCHERNGKVFLRAEIEDMRTLKFAGKTSPYDPFIDRGGFRCRHHWHWITAKQAARRDDTLFVNADGTLTRGAKPVPAPKPSAAPAPKETRKATAPDAKALPSFKAFETKQEAEAFARERGFASKVDFGKATAQQANVINKRLALIHDKYNVSPLDELRVSNDTAGGVRKMSTANGLYQRGQYNNGAITLNEANMLKPIAPASETREMYAKYKSDLAAQKELKKEMPHLYKPGSNTAKYFKDLSEAAKFDRWSVSSDGYGYESTIVHEFGHKLHDEIIGAFGANRRINQSLMSLEQAHRLNEDLRLAFEAAKKSGAINGVSNYAASKPEELFAEAFAMLELEPEKLHKDIADIMNKILSYARK
jgi:hypothetical protein